jgi:cholesterol oxidase
MEASNAAGAIHRVLRFVEQRIVARLTHSRQTDLDAQIEELIGDAHRSASVLPLLGMGLDTPDGVMSLDDNQFLALNWTTKSSQIYFDRVQDAMRLIANGLDAGLQVDPLWYGHKVITVHPVGGCSMGHSPGDGVIDNHGEVYGYPGFVIADGSAMPGPVGPNPSFTIAALSDRFADHQLGQGRPNR